MYKRQVLINVGLAVADGDGLLRADLGARMREAALAALGNPVLLRRAGVARELDDVHERRIVVLLADGARVHALGQLGVLRDRAQRQAHRQAKPLADDRSLQEDRLAVAGLLAGNDLVGDLLETAVVPSLSLIHIFKVGDVVNVRVLDVDLKKKRISLTMLKE